MKINCPICKNEYDLNKISVHYNKFHKDIPIYDFFKSIYGDTIDEVIQKYQEGYSLYELCNSTKRKTFSTIPRGIVENVLKEKNIKIRTVNESVKLERRNKKIKDTLYDMYGINNISQLENIKMKKAQTFIKHYGMDNIFKTKKFIDELDNTMLSKYGKKRISGFSNKSDEEKALIMQKSCETRIKNGYYDSSLERRVENVMLNNNITYKRCFWLYHHPYDFCFGNKCLLEIQGDYWHANPTIYKETDLFYNGKTAKDIWERDEKFKKCLDNSPFKLIYLWESEMKKMTDEDILIFLRGYL